MYAQFIQGTLNVYMTAVIASLSPHDYKYILIHVSNPNAFSTQYTVSYKCHVD